MIAHNRRYGQSELAVEVLQTPIARQPRSGIRSGMGWKIGESVLYVDAETPCFLGF